MGKDTYTATFRSIKKDKCGTVASEDQGEFQPTVSYRKNSLKYIKKNKCVII